MCGRYGIFSKATAVAKAAGAKVDEAYVPRYNAAPTQPLPVLASNAPQQVQLFRWGLIPHWAKDRKIAYRTINARAETIAEKASFKMPIRQQRCIVWANGYYEWEKTEEGKVPHWIALESGNLMGMAGIWDSWRSPDGHWEQTFSIITVPANDRLRTLHERMPAVLHPTHYASYLNKHSPLAEVLRVLRPLPVKAANAWEVSGFVNKATNEGAEAVKPLNPPRFL